MGMANELLGRRNEPDTHTHTHTEFHTASLIYLFIFEMSKNGRQPQVLFNSDFTFEKLQQIRKYNMDEIVYLFRIFNLFVGIEMGECDKGRRCEGRQQWKNEREMTEVIIKCQCAGCPSIFVHAYVFHVLNAM